MCGDQHALLGSKEPLHIQEGFLVSKSFLNALLPLEPDAQIEELESLPSNLVPKAPEVRKNIVNARCMDQKKRQFIVEM